LDQFSPVGGGAGLWAGPGAGLFGGGRPFTFGATTRAPGYETLRASKPIDLSYPPSMQPYINLYVLSYTSLCIYASYAAVYKLVYISYISLCIYASMNPMQPCINLYIFLI